MSNHYDELETRSPEQREEALMAALSRQVAHAQAHAPGFAAGLRGVEAVCINSRAALATLPILRKSDLKDLQRANLPLGGLTATPVRKLARLFMSPGPIYDPEGRRDDYWRSARPLYAAGFRAGDIVQNCFSYHLTPAGSMFECGAAQIGCVVIPAGVGQTEMQLQAASELRPDGYIGTPSFLKILLEKAEETKTDLSSIKKALTGGEALPPSLRTWFAERGIAVFQGYGTADLGNIAYETSTNGALNPGMVVDEELIVEIVRPGTGDPVPAGEVGEVVVTTLNPDYPLIRFATGDMSALLEGVSPCGRTNMRIKGWMGRADQTTKIRGMFVHPGQVAEVVKRHPALLKARLVVSGEMADDRMLLKCEVADWTEEGLQAAIANTVREVTKLRGDVVFVMPGELPNDGKVIEDARSYK
jgi:phenylacetate-CoA ligase